MSFRRWSLWSLLAGLSLLVPAWVGCSSSSDDEEDEVAVSDLQGSITIDGSSTVYPISQKMTEEFSAKYPKVVVSVGFSGTGGGFEKFNAGSIDICDASRPIKKSEAEAAAAAGLEYVEIPIAYDGLSIVVNPANTWVTQLTIDQLKTIFLADTAAKTWADVDPSWPAEEIKLYIPGTDSGTFDYFKEVVAGKEGAIRNEGVSTDENDNSLVGSIADNRNALGFFGAAYYFANKDRVRAVPIVNPEGVAVAPTAESIEDGTYAPFGRPLFIYVSTKSLERLEVQKFIDFYVANAGQFASDPTIGYVQLPDSIYEIDRSNVEQRTPGSRYLDASGEPVSGTLLEVYGVTAAE